MKDKLSDTEEFSLFKGNELNPFFSGTDRRKFLKRTGGATAAAALGWIPSDLAAHPGTHGISETWVMDHNGPTPANLDYIQVDLTLQGDTTTKNVRYKLTIFSQPKIGESTQGTNQTTLRAEFLLAAYDLSAGGVKITSVFQKWDTTVICDAGSGHISQTENQLADSNGNTGVPTSSTFSFDGRTFKITLNAWSDVQGSSGKHTLQSRARTFGVVSGTFVGVNGGSYGGYRFPSNPIPQNGGNPLADQLQKINGFDSRML